MRKTIETAVQIVMQNCPELEFTRAVYQPNGGLEVYFNTEDGVEIGAYYDRKPDDSLMLAQVVMAQVCE